MYFMLLVVCLSVLIMLLVKQCGSEHYDDVKMMSTVAKCAEFCKTTTDCYGFAFDKKTNTCYPSRNIIDQRSFDHLICNKIITITEAKEIIPFSERRSNAMFVCTEKLGYHPSFYFHNQNKFNKIHEKQNFDFIVNVDEYSVKDHDWMY